jgi:CRP/FNR family transcriptional regulator/CRP/FNR family cyclic AMP-dependent transcriptional regulator
MDLALLQPGALDCGVLIIDLDLYDSAGVLNALGPSPVVSRTQVVQRDSVVIELPAGVLEAWMSKVTMLQKVSFFSRLTSPELEALALSLGKRTFGKGTIIFHKGSPGRSLYIIESGRVRIFLLSDSGQEISVNVYGPGDVFGELALLDGLPRSAGAVVMERTVVYTLHRDDFVRLLDHSPRVAKSIIQDLSSRLRYTTACLEQQAFLDVNGRVAAKLLELADRYGRVGEGIEIDLRLTQTELASWVSARRESVNKVLGAFRDQGLIEIDGQQITILNRAGLEDWIRY